MIGRRISRSLDRGSRSDCSHQALPFDDREAPAISSFALDGEAVPGVMGLCRQLKDEIANCPPILVLTGRRDDAWLATWSRADGVLGHPIDPLRLPAVVATMLRGKTGKSLATRG